jgi:isoleucyl-tRNA synthetase
LSKVMVHTSEDTADLPVFLSDIVRDELNVGQLEFVSDVGRLVDYRVLPNNQLLGPKFGSRFPDVRAALSQLDGGLVNDKVSALETVVINLDGEDVELSPEEVLVEVFPVEGLAVATEKGITVAVDTVITKELRLEGLAREFVRRVQDLRKQADFNISDRIEVYYQASEDLSVAAKVHREYIMNEVLAVLMEETPPPEGTFTTGEKLIFENEELLLGLKQIG